MQKLYRCAHFIGREQTSNGLETSKHKHLNTWHTLDCNSFIYNSKLTLNHYHTVIIKQLHLKNTGRSYFLFQVQLHRCTVWALPYVLSANDLIKRITLGALPQELRAYFCKLIRTRMYSYPPNSTFSPKWHCSSVPTSTAWPQRQDLWLWSVLMYRETKSQICELSTILESNQRLCS